MACKFLISGLTQLDADWCAIDGRVLDQSFERNHVFTLCTYQPLCLRNDQFVDDPARGLPDRQVQIEINQIQAYEKDLSQAHTGLVYRLIASQKDTELLGIGWILTN